MTAISERRRILYASFEMKSIIRKLFDPKFYTKIPSSIRYRLIRIYQERYVLKTASKEKIFTSIFRNNYWGSAESLSGGGATLIYTENLRRNIPIIFREYGIKSVFDAPCGDMNWMQHLIKNEEFAYLGGDIVSEIIERNINTFKYNNVNFVKFDISSDSFPNADIWICRAALYHLSNRDIFLALEKFSESNIKYILTTNCTTDDKHLNKDITTGDWRSLNLMLPPFNFPKRPLWEIDDYVDPYPPERICLWTREQINNVLPSLRETYQR